MASEVGDGIAFVSAVYLIVLLPWGFLYFHDFISDRWRGIGQTFRDGIIHIVIVSVPMPVIIVYIVLQRRLPSPDNKEMYAAITALVLSLYHLLRTLWGLQQLLRFRRWVVQTAVTMERAAYPCKLQSPQFAPPSQLRRRRSSSSFVEQHKPVPPPPKSRLERLRELAASLRWRSENHSKNGKLFSSMSMSKSLNQVTPLPLHMKAPTRVKDRCLVHDSMFNKSTADGSIDSTRRKHIEQQVDQMRVNSSLIDNEFIGSSAPRIRPFTLEQVNPHDTFVRWSLAYLAHFGAAWLIDSKTKPFNRYTWNGRRYSLAVDVWATASLRMETLCKKFQPVLNHTIGTAPAAPMENITQVSFLAPSLWHYFLPSLHDQIFSKDALLLLCLRNGNGFPYGKHILKDDERIPPFGMYKGLIKDALADLPAALYDVVDGISPDQLHWFAIFIWIAEWNGCGHDSAPAYVFNDQSPQSPQPDGTTKGATVLNATHAPVRTLQDQLGIDDDLALNRITFPFVRQRYGRYLWSNRSVLEVSARIDNWLCLRIGHQFVKLFKQYELYGPDTQAFKKAHVVNDDDFSTEENQMRRSDRIFNFHRRLEMGRLRYQLGRIDLPLRHLDQGITFMGCTMETVRSYLAQNVRKYMNDTLPGYSDWQPPLRTDADAVESFPISAQLEECLQAVNELGKERFDSTVQERLLWECQNGLVFTLDDIFSRNDAKLPAYSCPQLIMLTVLAFPALNIIRLDTTSTKENADESNHGQADVEQTRQSASRLVFRIKAPAAPQRIFVEVEVIMTGQQHHSQVKLRLASDPEEQNFRWQDWRDAVLGRLYGKSEWQRSHFMRILRVNRTHEPITQLFNEIKVGENRVVPLWKGWQPFRARIRKFELQHSSLIIVGHAMPVDSEFTPATSFDSIGIRSSSNNSIPKRKDAPQLRHTERQHGRSSRTLPHYIGPNNSPYLDASADALSDASMHVDSVLRLNSSLFAKEGREEMTSALEPVSDDDPFGSGAFPIMSPSPTGSNENLQISMKFMKPGQGQNDLLNEVNEQNDEAMERLATYLLNGTNKFRKDRNRALLLLERAVAIGKNVTTASRFVKALFDTPIISEEVVRRALQAVDLLWRDMPRRVDTVEVAGIRRRQWRKNAAEGEAHMLKLIRLHLKVINADRRAEVMCDLGNKLSMWGMSRDDEQLAILLYESAIIADCNVWAMVGLALKQIDRDAVYAKRLYERAISERHEDDPEGILRAEILEYVQNLSMDGDKRARKLLRGM